MPSRKRFAVKAVTQFLRQTLHRRESALLVVASQGVEGFGFPDDERIRLVDLRYEIRPLGAKRNMLCSLAQSEWIAHWDDDDWRADDYLERIVADAGTAQVYARCRGWFDDGTHAWLYCGGPSHGIGSTLLYRRSWWQTHRFPELQVGEDCGFVFAACARRAARISTDLDGFVARDHGANTSPRNRPGTGWKLYPRTGLPQAYLEYLEDERCV
jgi:hypothetical protein